MPRRDLTEERAAQILDAFERCVGQRGLRGTSLEDVALEAGVKRSIIRHYIGNRDELILAMAMRCTDRYLKDLKDLKKAAVGKARVDILLEALFPATSSGAASDVVLIEALIAAAEDLPDVGSQISKLIRLTVDAVQHILEDEHPRADKQQVWGIAYGVVSICFNDASLVQLKLPKKYRLASISSARKLVGTLERR